MVERFVQAMQLKLSEIFHHPQFPRLWAGQAISGIGSQITVTAFPLVAALTLNASPLEMGLLRAASFAPTLLFGLFVGVVVDRLRRRPILIIGDFTRMLLLGTIPIAGLLGFLSMMQLYIVAFLSGTCTIFFDVAFLSVLPVLIGRKQLVEANSKFHLSEQVASVLGPSLGGALVQLFTAPLAIAADALSYLISGLFLIFTPFSETKPTSEESKINVWGEVGEGLKLVVDNPILRPIAACTATINLSDNIILAVVVLYMLNQLHFSALVIGIIFAALSAGSIVGIFLAAPMTRYFGLGRAMILSSLIVGGSGALIPLASGSPFVAVSLLLTSSILYGLALPVYEINQVSLRQVITPDRLLGRLNATMRFIAWGSIPLGALIGGILGSLIDLRPTLIVGVVVGFFACIWTYLSPIKDLRELPASVEQPENSDT
jgi:MFS family permease